jgi:hypothetical protein
MPNKSRICSDQAPSRTSTMRKDAYPFPEEPVHQDPVPDYRADIRSIRDRYRDYRKAIGDVDEYKFEEEEE